MRTERLLRANGSVYGFVSGYKETRYHYIFIVNRKEHRFLKSRYILSIKSGYYDLEFIGACR